MKISLRIKQNKEVTSKIFGLLTKNQDIFDRFEESFSLIQNLNGKAFFT